MKKIVVCVISIITITIASCKKETLELPADFTASQGTYIGVVHLAYGDIDGQAIVSRFNEDNAQWEEISWTWSGYWDDNGYLLPNGIIPGKEYRYKMRLHSDGPGYSEYSKEITGYAFNGKESEIKSINREKSGNKVNLTINWINPNNLKDIKNGQDIYYDIYRTEDGNYADYEMIKSIWSSFNNGDPQDEWSYEDSRLEPEKNYTYEIVTRYMYDFNDSNGDYRDYNTYSCDGSSFDNQGSGGNPVTEYTVTDLGQVLAASSGIIKDLKDKMLNNTLYLGVITDAGMYGKPALYRLNGLSWQNVWSSVPDVEYDKIDFAVSGSDSYLAGIRDSLSVFQYDGSSWSSNLTPDNLGQADSPSAISIEAVNDMIYMAIEQHPDYNLQVLKYTEGSWNRVGGDANGIIASGSVFDPELENINGTLYLHYSVDNVLHIKHLEGSSWISDLEWEQEWLNDINLVKIGSTLYFSSGSASTDFDAGVYRIDNASTVTNLIPDEHEAWFTMGAFDLTADSDGNLIVSSMKFELDDSYPHLNVYDGAEWKTISGDFTNGVSPVAVTTSNNTIYYIYGDASSVNAVNNPTSIKSKKITK